MKSWYSIIIYQEVLPVFVVIASAVFWIRNIFKVMRENSAPPPCPRQCGGRSTKISTKVWFWRHLYAPASRGGHIFLVTP